LEIRRIGVRRDWGGTDGDAHKRAMDGTPSMATEFAHAFDREAARE